MSNLISGSSVGAWLRSVRSWKAGLACLGWLCAAGPALASLDEAEVKAAIVYNLLQFVEWPEMQPPGRIFVLCLRAGSDLVVPLQKLGGQPVHGFPLEVRSLAGGDTRGCHVAYVDGSDAERLALLRRLRGEIPAFVIADRAAIAEESTAIQLRWVDNKIGFEVNMGSVKRSGAQVSSRILRLAKVVRE
ncbi:MAG: YfiR family protein [Rhodoferax sp.]|nr:YfiR family protein [Rhodoferax sp.]